MPVAPARAVVSPGRRHRRRRAAALAGALLCLGGCASDGPDRDGLQSWGYASWWLPPKMRELRAARFDRIAFFEVQLSATGGIVDAHGWPDRQAALRKAARRLRTPLDVTVTLRGKADFETLFGSAENVARLLETCLRLADDPMLQGLQIDIEHYDESSPQALAALRAFVPALAGRLHAATPRRSLSVFVPTGGPALYDAASLAEVDWAVMQAYDAHWIEGPDAGPVAPLDGPEAVTWNKVLTNARTLGLPARRIVMSYPLYGYEWPVTTRDPRGASTGPAGTTTLARAHDRDMPGIAGNVAERVRLHGCSHDPRSGSSNYLYPRPGGGWVSGWYEGAWSLGRKREFLVRNDLAGIAFFVAGYDAYALASNLDRKRSSPPLPAAEATSCP